MAIDLRGRTIVITGASSGIGAATARACAAAGMQCVVAARREQELAALADEGHGVALEHGVAVGVRGDQRFGG